MRRFAVGDLQGHLKPLQILLNQVGFDPGADTLWVVGDLVNKGPENVAVLEYLSSLPNCRVVLGNHDLHLLALAESGKSPRRNDTLNDILHHPQRERCLDWLRRQPLLVRDDDARQVMVHAGLPPSWSVDVATACARELEAVLADPAQRKAYLGALYGNEDLGGATELAHVPPGPARWRALTNYFTRMRFVTPDNHLDFAHSGPPEKRPDGFQPWYELRPDDGWQIIFGHWAALMGRTGTQRCIGLDTGYCWGNWLTLYNLDSGERFTTPSPDRRPAG